VDLAVDRYPEFRSLVRGMKKVTERRRQNRNRSQSKIPRKCV
jgi:hypothetical protein